MSRLGRYRGKRDSARTTEPAGDEPAGDEPAGDEPEAEAGPARAPRAGQPGHARRFVVQRHRAGRLHYDLRFEIDGVLVSWAVPRGPTLDPAVKRTAIQVEDHPIEYLDFEGVIPHGEYGGGDVIVWDRGTWEPHATADPAAAVAAGELHADLSGQKLNGRLVLVRRGSDGLDGNQWILLHKRDEYAVDGWDPEEHPRSVLSGRTSEEVRARPDQAWRPGLPPARASVAVRGADEAVPVPAGDPGIRGPGPDELAALDALPGGGGRWDVFGRALRVTNLDKMLFPARGGDEPVTKRELVRYAAEIAPVALPYLAGRPLNMYRAPGGAGSGAGDRAAGGAGFWHKQLPAHAPGWLPRWDDPDAGPGKTSTYLVVDEPAALVWAANFGALEWHAWTATAAAPAVPSYALIDIDPGPATSWDDVLLLARLHHTALDHLSVRAQPKVTGRRGLQIWVPVAPKYDFGETRAWVERLSRAVGAAVPELVSWKWDVSERGGRARLDYTQNVHNKTLVAPYSPRALAGAPVSAPIGWDELDDPGLRPGTITVRTVLDRVARRGDPFRGVLGCAQDLPPVR